MSELRFECIGKGGVYEKLGYAKPSGALRTIQGESGIIVYRDIAAGQLYFRDPADFQQRMRALPPPTVEYRPRRSPPPPPPLRNPNAGHDHSGVFVWVAVMMLCVAFGMLMGWKMHG